MTIPTNGTPASSGSALPTPPRTIQKQESAARTGSTGGIPPKFKAISAADQAVAMASGIVVEALKVAGQLERVCARRGEMRAVIAEARVQIERSLKPELAKPHLEKLDIAEGKFIQGLDDACSVIRKEDR
jgi:hypothetical protein